MWDPHQLLFCCVAGKQSLSLQSSYLLSVNHTGRVLLRDACHCFIVCCSLARGGEEQRVIMSFCAGRTCLMAARYLLQSQYFCQEPAINQWPALMWGLSSCRAGSANDWQMLTITTDVNLIVLQSLMMMQKKGCRTIIIIRK